VTATLAAGEDTLSIEIHPQGGADGVINSLNASISLDLVSIQPENAGSQLQGLGADILLDGEPIGPISFNLVDADTALLQHELGINNLGAEARGLHVVHVDDSHVYQPDEPGAAKFIVGTNSDDVIQGTAGNDVIYGGSGNNVLYGGGGNDTFIWNNASMGGTDRIGDFHEGNILRFDDLFGGGQDANVALESLLSGSLGTRSWDGATFRAEAADGSASIQLNIAEATATLTVSYEAAFEHGHETMTQNVVLGGFDVTPLMHQDVTEVARLLQDIIKVGGNA